MKERNYTLKKWNEEIKKFGGEQESSEYGVPVGAVVVDPERLRKILGGKEGKGKNPITKK